MCSIDIFVNLQLVGRNLEGGLFNARFGGLWGDVRDWGWAHSTAHPWVSISSPSTHVVYLLPFFLSYLAGSKSVSARPPDPDTITNTALEVTDSSSGKSASKLNVWQFGHVLIEPCL